jgi:hypothetical protein
MVLFHAINAHHYEITHTNYNRELTAIKYNGSLQYNTT